MSSLISHELIACVMYCTITRLRRQACVAAFRFETAYDKLGGEWGGKVQERQATEAATTTKSYLLFDC